MAPTIELALLPLRNFAMKDVCARDPAMELLQYPNTKLPMPATKIVCDAGQKQDHLQGVPLLTMILVVVIFTCTCVCISVGVASATRWFRSPIAGDTTLVGLAKFTKVNLGKVKSGEGQIWGRSGYQLCAGEVLVIVSIMAREKPTKLSGFPTA
jgi:hypothetical protein